MAFFVRPLGTTTLGNRLRSLRKRQGISLDAISRQTKLQRKHLEALEEDRHYDLPDRVYTRRFLGLYVEALGGDEAYFLSRYDEECGMCPAQRPAQRLPLQRVQAVWLLAWRVWALRVAIGVASALAVLYVWGQLYDMVRPPALLVDSPAQDMQTTSLAMDVSGQTEPGASVLLNGIAVANDETGRFSTSIILEPGLNTLTIHAQKKYGRPTTVVRAVFLEVIGRPQPPLDTRDAL